MKGDEGGWGIDVSFSWHTELESKQGWRVTPVGNRRETEATQR